MSVTEDRQSRGPVVEVSNSNGSTHKLTPKYMVRTIKALYDGDPRVLTRILIESYHITPLATSSALAALANGSKGDRLIAARIFDALYDRDPILANSILFSLYNKEPWGRSSDVSASSISPSTPTSQSASFSGPSAEFSSGSLPTGTAPTGISP